MSRIIEQYIKEALTKRELIDLLLELDVPDDMPVLIGYEGTVDSVEAHRVSLVKLPSGYEVLLIDAC